MPDPQLYNERDILLRISEGDEAAFEQLFRHYVVKVSHIVFRIAQHDGATQDLVQDVFVQLWLGRHKLLEVQDLDLWIYRITYNLSYNYIRRQQRLEKATAIMGVEHALLDYANDTQAVLDYTETARLIHRAVDQLPLQARRIYQLSRVQGLKAQAIADELGISVQGVRNSLTRSAKLIRDYLAQNGIPLPLFLFLITLPEIL